jgi:tetratricopeptide (TPR) repeat protein
MLADGSDPEAAAPETLQGVVSARIDALPAEEKEILQLASTLGKVFWTDALATLSGIDPRQLDDRLHALERKEFVRREHRSAVAGSKQYAFVHALVRDGAYGQMSRAARADVHVRVADWIETLPADRADDRAEIMAYHLLEAIEYSRAVGRDRADLIPRASRALRESGNRSWRIGALNAAVESYTRLRALDPSVEEDPYFLLEIGLALATGDFTEVGIQELERAAEALEARDPAAAAQATITRGEFEWQRGDQDGAFAYFDKARALAERAPLSPQRQFAVSQVGRFLALAGRYDEALPVVEESIDMAQELGDDELLGDSLNNRAIVRAALLQPGWEEDFARSLELTLRTNSYRATRAYVNYGSNLTDTAGDIERAEAVTRSGLAYARKLGLAEAVLRWFNTNLGEILYYAGRWDEALDLAEHDIASGPHYVRQVSYGVRAEIRLGRGDAAGATADAEAALSEARSIRDPQALLPSLVTAAIVAHATGDISRAHSLLDEFGTPDRGVGAWVVQAALLSSELGRDVRFGSGPADAIPTPWREAARAIGDGDLPRTIEILEPTGARTFVAAVQLHAAHDVGRRAVAAAQYLIPALAFYRVVGASAYVREAEALLAEAS